MKHLEMADAFIRQIVKRRLVKLRKIPGGENVADILTKHVSKEVLDKHWNATGWKQHEESSAVVAKLERVNRLCDIKPTDDIVRAHQEKQRQATMSQGVALSRAHDEK